MRDAHRHLTCSSQRPLGDLFVFLDIFHGIAITAGTPYLGHTTPIFPKELECPNGDINDLFVDQRLLTANRTAVEVFLRRWPKGAVEPFPGLGLFRVVVHIDLV